MSTRGITYKITALDQISGVMRNIFGDVHKVDNAVLGLNKDIKKTSAPIRAMGVGVGVMERKSTRHINKMSSGLGGLKKKFGGIGSYIAGAFAIGSITRFGGAVTDTLAEFEKYEAVLGNTLGSESAARKELKSIKKLASGTPFQVSELTGAFVKLTNSGFKPAMSDMMKMSDLASSTGNGFDQLSEAVLDAKTGEFERLKEFGIKAKSHGDKIAFTFKGQTKEVNNSSDAIQKYVLGLGSMNGVIGASEKIMGTTGGVLSNLKDKFINFKLGVGTAFKPLIASVLGSLSNMLDTFNSKVVPVLSTIVKWVQLNKVQLTSMGLTILKVAGGFTAAFVAAKSIMTITKMVKALRVGYVLFSGAMKAGTIAQWLLNAAMNANPIGLITTGLFVAGTAIYALSKRFGGMRNMLASFGKWIANNHPFMYLTDKVFPGFKQKIFGLFKWVYDTVLKPIGKFIGGLFDFDVPDFGFKSVPEKTRTRADAYKELHEGEENGDSGKSTLSKFSSSSKESKGNHIANKVSEISSGTGTIKNINITIGKLIEKMIIQAERINQSPAKIQAEVGKALISAVNDTNYS